MNVEIDAHSAFARAVAFAACAHDGQYRKGGTLPYIVHPMEAAAIAATMTDDGEVLSAAVLHDVAEDCGVTAEELQQRFGPRVAALVLSVSEEKYADAAGTWRLRKQREVERLRTAERETLILALSDKLSNLRSLDRDLRAEGAAVWLRFNQTDPAMHKWYYTAMGEALAPLKQTDAYREYRTLLDRVFGAEEEHP